MEQFGRFFLFLCLSLCMVSSKSEVCHCVHTAFLPPSASQAAKGTDVQVGLVVRVQHGRRRGPKLLPALLIRKMGEGAACPESKAEVEGKRKKGNSVA